MRYHRVQCPNCGLCDDHDEVLSRVIIYDAYDTGEIIVVEERKCDICLTKYEVKRFFGIQYEELNN